MFPYVTDNQFATAFEHSMRKKIACVGRLDVAPEKMEDLIQDFLLEHDDVLQDYFFRA